MVSKAKSGKVVAKYEYKPDIYGEAKNIDQMYQEAVGNKEALTVELYDIDLRPFQSELYNQQFPQFLCLTTIKLEYCNLDSFVPKQGLGKLKHLSLLGNQVPNMNTIRLSQKDERDLKAEQSRTDGNRNLIPDVVLETLNLSDNMFEGFPWVAINEMDKLREINLSRNRMSQLFDPVEKKEMQSKLNEPFKGGSINKQPFARFPNLTILDLSSNFLQIYPIELNVLKLDELNLMHN